MSSVKEEWRGLVQPLPDQLIGLMKKPALTEHYHVEQTPFARGKFASVRKIRHLATGVEYAAKFIRKRRRAVDTTREIHHEVAVLMMCADSMRLVRLHEMYETRSEIVLVLELASGGDLQKVLDDEARLSEPHARRCMKQILEGLSHLHSRNIAHLDLKPQNLLLTSDYPNGEVKLCDFGISRLIEPGVEVREILGTPDYVAPEVLSFEPISLATDIWSVGVLAYVLLSGYSPFGGSTKQETFLNISQCALNFPTDIFPNVSNEAFDFIKAALVVDAKYRPTVKECLEHPWLNEDTELTFDNLENLPIPQIDDIERKLIVIIPENNGKDEKDSDGGVTTSLKHSHHIQTSPPFPDAPSTPKVSRKSHPDSPTSVLNLCKKFQADPPKFCNERIINSKVCDKCDNRLFTNGKLVEVICKTYESIPSGINGKTHTKENHPLNIKNVKSNCNKCLNYENDVRKVSSDTTFGDCSPCDVQSCNLLSTHKPPATTITHTVDRGILC